MVATQAVKRLYTVAAAALLVGSGISLAPTTHPAVPAAATVQQAAPAPTADIAGEQREVSQRTRSFGAEAASARAEQEQARQAEAQQEQARQAEAQQEQARQAEAQRQAEAEQKAEAQRQAADQAAEAAQPAAQSHPVQPAQPVQPVQSVQKEAPAAPAAPSAFIPVVGAGGQSAVDACVGPVRFTPVTVSVSIAEHDLCGGWNRMSWIQPGTAVTVQGYGTYTAYARMVVPQGAKETVLGGFAGGYPPIFLQTCIPGTANMLVIALR